MSHLKGKPWFERHPAFIFVIIIVAGFLLIDFLSAILFLPYDYNSFRTPHYAYHHDLLPNCAAQNIWGDRIFNVYTNSLGFKDKSCRDVQLVPDKRRILFIGDSFTESMGMTWEESFAGILSEKLQDIEILNAGVVSYSPKLYYLKVKYLIEQTGLKFNELFVFLDNSDPMNEITYSDFKPYSKKSFKNFKYKLNRYFFNHSYLYHSVSAKIITSRKSDVTASWNPVSGEGFPDESANESENFIAATLFWSYNKNAFEKWGKRGLQLAGNYMQNLSGLCKQHHIELKVVIYPWPPLISNRDLHNLQVSYWDEFCQKNKLQFINLFPNFITGDIPDEIIRKYFIPGDVHWNQEGNQFVAEALKPFIVR